MASAFPHACECCDSHTKCCFCRYKGKDWTKSLLGFPKFRPNEVIPDWLATGGGKVSLTRAYQFQRECYIHDVSTSTVGEDGQYFIKSRCFRSLEKSKPPHAGI